MSSFVDVVVNSAIPFGTIFLAELGDKSQIVCMTLAACHRPKPVLLGAILAFAVLNLLAVTVGASIALVLPDGWIQYLAAGLFFVFGVLALLSKDEDDDEEQTPHSAKRLILTTFSLIFLAELGDKTQIAVMTLSTSYSPVLIWTLATIALGTTAALGVFAGRKLMARLNIALLHKLSGVFFIVLAGLLLL